MVVVELRGAVLIAVSSDSIYKMVDWPEPQYEPTRCRIALYQDCTQNELRQTAYREPGLPSAIGNSADDDAAAVSTVFLRCCCCSPPAAETGVEERLSGCSG